MYCQTCEHNAVKCRSYSDYLMWAAINVTPMTENGYNIFNYQNNEIR